MSVIRVVIADDEALMRHALRLFVESADDMVVVGEAVDGIAAVRLAIELRPDVVLMDMQMPGIDGVAATQRIVEEAPDIRVLALTTFSSDRYLVAALRAGASAYLVKDTEPEDLVAAIRDVHEGSAVVSPQLTRDLIRSVREPQGDEHDETGGAASADGSGLSDRELAVVRLLGRGMSNAEIARELFVSEATVKTHLGHVMTKWGVRDRVQTLIAAVRAHLVDLS